MTILHGSFGFQSLFNFRHGVKLLPLCPDSNRNWFCVVGSAKKGIAKNSVGSSWQSHICLNYVGDAVYRDAQRLYLPCFLTKASIFSCHAAEKRSSPAGSFPLL